jgi:hypothetical protein
MEFSDDRCRGVGRNDKCQQWERRFQKIDEMASVVMRFPDERLASFTCSFGGAEVSH